MKIAPGNNLIKTQKDPRYLYLRIIDLKLRPYSFKHDKFILKMQLASKYSDSIVDINKLQVPEKRQRIQGEAHIFKYEAEEFMNITLEERSDRQKKDKKDKNQERKDKKDKNQGKGNSLSGYCRILLPPLIQYPHICHTVNAQLITVRNKTQFNVKPVADLIVQIYYRLDFSAYIDIIPISATLVRSIAEVGQMRPIVELQHEEQKWESLQAGGIHPHWSGHFHARRQKKKPSSRFMSILNVGKNLEDNANTKQQRNFYHSLNLEKYQEKSKYFDIVRFNLHSAGCFLRVKVYAYPTVGKTPEVAGFADIRMSNHGFFKYPQPFGSNNFVSQQIELYKDQDGESKAAGNLSLDIRFIFDKNNVISQGPFIQVMPRPKMEIDEDKLRNNKENDGLKAIL